MKIAPISINSVNLYTKNYPQKQVNRNVCDKDSVLVDRNYSQLLIKKQAPMFKSTNPNDILQLVKTIPLEDKISAILPKFRRGDMIIVGDKLATIQRELKSSISNMDDVIKKVIFIREPEYKGFLVFTKNANGLNEVWNFNKEPITLNNFDFIKTNESYYVAQGDVLSLQDQSIVIKERPTGKNPLRPNNIGAFAHLFSQTFDFTKDTTNTIERLNKKNISELVKTQKGMSKKLSFADVGGQDEIIDHLEKHILFPIKFPDAHETMKINHGTILYGPPGTGKSLIAEAIANESDAYYKKLNGLELATKWVGESEENWRKLFAEAIDNQPTIIFIDEFDAVARSRTGQYEYGDNVVNQILTLMSDLEKSGDDVYIITATNNYESLDAAIKRPGRFGYHLEVKAPDLKGINQILQIHTNNKPLADDVKLKELADKMYAQKMTGAEIAHIVAIAHTNAFERTGIYAKMKANQYTPKDMKDFKIELVDFEKAMNEYKSDATKRTPVGFKK